MKRRTLTALALGAMVLLAGCVLPGSPGTDQRNRFLEANAGFYAISLGATVEAPGPPTGIDDYNRCWDNIRKIWLSGAASRFGTRINVCYTLTLPTADTTRGSVYMHEVGHAYWYRLDEEGHTPGGDFADTELFADCFSANHGGNRACGQNHLTVLGWLEDAYPPNNSTDWWTP